MHLFCLDISFINWFQNLHTFTSFQFFLNRILTQVSWNSKANVYSKTVLQSYTYEKFMFQTPQQLSFGMGKDLGQFLAQVNCE